MTIKFWLRGSKNNKQSIIVDVSVSRDVRVKIATGWQISPKEWNENKNMPKNKPSTLNLILQMKEMVQFIENSAVVCKEKITKEKVKEWIDDFRGYETQDQLISYHFQKKIETLSNIRTKRIYVCVLNIVEEYQKRYKPLNLKDFTPNLANKLSLFFQEKGLAPNTIKIYIDIIKIVVCFAEKTGYEISSKTRTITTKLEKKSIQDIVYLNFEEIKRIKDLDLSDSPQLENIRKWVVLGCDIGQRFSDLIKITPKDVFLRNGRHFIRVHQQKTGVIVTIPLFDDAKSILLNQENFPHRINLTNFNEKIKLLCKKAGINQEKNKRQKCSKTKASTKSIKNKWECVSSHTMRRSFASNYYTIIDTPLLRNITGHSTEQMLLKYIGVSSNDTAELALEQYLKNKEKSY